MNARTYSLTALAMLAFAGNSVLCRMALAEDAIDPLSFTGLRLASGALALLAFVRSPGDGSPWDPRAALALFVYALGFSLAYVTLEAGTGALLLFGAVQLTMLGAGWARGERLGRVQLGGLVLALGGVLLLVAPGLRSPRPWGALAMLLAGAAWGVYSLLGRGGVRPATATARNFLMCAPVGLALLFFVRGTDQLGLRGVLLACASGALTSGLGYVLWYAALGGLSATAASVVQLSVPALAALGGAMLLGEAWTVRLILAALMTLGGVLLVLLVRPVER